MNWLSGEVTLPTASVARLRRAWRNRHNERIEEAYDFVKRFRSKNPSNSRIRWEYALQMAEHQPSCASPARQIGIAVARSMGGPRAVKWADFKEEYRKRASVQSNAFPMFLDSGQYMGQVYFAGRKMFWVVSSADVFQIDKFMRSSDYRFLVDCVAAVKWHRGTGGGDTRYDVDSHCMSKMNVFGPKGKRYREVLEPAVSVPFD